jgi:hypothetical protein
MIRSAVRDAVRGGTISAFLPESSQLLPWQDYRLTEGLLAEWAFAEGTGRSVADNSGNGKTINLDLPTTPNDTWTAQGIATAAGLIQTPSLTGARTVVMLIKVPQDQVNGFILSGGNGSGNGVIPNGVTTTYGYHTASVRGVVSLYQRAATGQANYRLNSGGWYLLFTDFNAAYTTPLGFGGRHSTTTSRCATFEIAYAAAFSGVLSDADRSQMYLLGRSLLKDRAAYMDWRDCPTSADFVAIWGQSNAEGRAKLADLSGADAARTTPNTYINVRGNRTNALLVKGTNQQTAAPSTDFGPEMGLAWSHEDVANGRKLYISTHAVGSTFLANTGGIDWSLEEGETSNLCNAALRTMWAAEAQMLNLGIGPRLRGIFWMQGENDATNATYGAAYQANLTTLIAKAREQTGDPDTKFLIARIRNLDPAFNASAVAAVRAAQVALGSIAPSAWIDTDDLPLAGDSVHYNAAGMKALGQRVYQYLF